VKFYRGTLTVLSVVLLALITFYHLNELINFVNISQYKHIIKPIVNFGPIVIMCFFAFGGLFGRVLSKILFTFIVILLIILIVAIFAPNFVQKMFNVRTTTQILNLIGMYKWKNFL